MVLLVIEVGRAVKGEEEMENPNSLTLIIRKVVGLGFGRRRLDREHFPKEIEISNCQSIGTVVLLVAVETES